MAHVLIGFGEALPAPEVVFSLLNAGHTVSAFVRNPGLPLARLPLQKVHVLPSPEDDAEAAVEGLRQIMQSAAAPDLVLPLDDVGLWLVNAALPDGGKSAGAAGYGAEVALDKALQMSHASDAGLAVPTTQVLQTQDDLPQITQFPAIIKPADAITFTQGRLTKGGACYVLSPEDLPKAKDDLAEEPGPFLVQPLIHGVGEGVFGFVCDEGSLAWSGHRRLRMMNPHGSGSSACQALMPDLDLQEKITHFLTAIGWRGAFMMEFLRDADGTPWFMELNGRMWGSMALARRQGFEYPAWNIALTEDEHFCPALPQTAFQPIVLRNLGRELLHLLFVLRGPKSAFHAQNWPRFWRSVRGVLRPGRGYGFYNYDPAHRSYMIRDAVWTLRKALKR